MLATLAALALAAAAPAAGDGTAALLERARAARDAGRLDEALQALDAVLAAEPAHEALLERGRVLAWQGRTREALAAYRAFREAHPERALEADLLIAQAQAWGGETTAALATLAPWVGRGERDAVLDDATYRTWAGDIDDAAERLQGWLASHPDDRAARLRLARAHSWQSRWEEARAGYQRVLEQAPGDVEATLGLAQLDLWQGRLAAARGRLEALPPEARARPELRLLEARLAAAEGRPADARAVLVPLLGGPAGREAERLLDDIVAGQGPWLRLGGTTTTTSDGLTQRLPALTARFPVLQGRADLEGGWTEVSLGGETRGAAAASLLASHPLRDRGSAEAGVGFRGDYGGAQGLTGRAGAALLVLPGLSLRVDAARHLLDVTPAAVDQRAAIVALDGGLTWTFGGGTRSLGAGGGTGWLSAGTRRGGMAFSGEQRAGWRRFAFRLGALVRGFGYSETRPELGFFNPERFRYAGLDGSVAWGRGSSLELEAGLRGGWQEVNHDPWQFGWGYSLLAAWGARGVQLLAAWSQSFAGLPVTTPQDPSEYREQTLRLAIRVSGRPGKAAAQGR